MNPSRYEQLTARLMDGELTETEGAELAAALRADPALARDLHRQLVLWETWSQHSAQERSASAFVAAWQTRLRAEVDAASFGTHLMRRITGTDPIAASPVDLLSGLWHRLWKPALGMSAAASVGLLAWWLWRPAPPAQSSPQVAKAAPANQPAVPAAKRAVPAPIAPVADRPQVVSLTGECVCPKCVLHQGQKHELAFRFTQDGVTKVALLKDNPGLAKLQMRFCGGPALAVASGTLTERAGQLVIASAQVEFKK